MMHLRYITHVVTLIIATLIVSHSTSITLIVSSTSISYCALLIARISVAGIGASVGIIGARIHHEIKIGNHRVKGLNAELFYSK